MPDQDQGAEDRPVGEPARQPGAADHAEAERRGEDRHRRLRQAADLGHGRGDVGVDGEEPAEADRTGEQREHRLAVAEEQHLLAPGRRRVAGHRRHEGQDQHHGEQREHGGREVRRAPAELLAQPGRGRDADDVGDREPEHHARDGASAVLGGGHAGGHQRRDAEVGAVREAVEEPGDGEHAVAAGEGAEHVEDGVRRHQPDQQRATRQLGAEDRDHRGTDDHAERVRRDQVPGLRDRDADAVGDLGQQAHRHELGGADREATQPERQHGEPVVAGRAPHWCRCGSCRRHGGRDPFRSSVGVTADGVRSTHSLQPQAAGRPIPDARSDHSDLWPMGAVSTSATTTREAVSMRKLLTHLSIGRRLAIAFGLLCVLVAVVAATGVHAASQQVDIRRRAGSTRADARRRQGAPLPRRRRERLAGLHLRGGDHVDAGSGSRSRTPCNMSGLNESRDAVYAILDSIDTGAMTGLRASGLRDDRASSGTPSSRPPTPGPSSWGQRPARATCTRRSSSSTTDRWPPPGRTSSRPLRSSSTRSTSRTIAPRPARRRRRQARQPDHPRRWLPRRCWSPVLMGIAVTRSIVRPLRRCVDAIDRIAEGDLTASAQIEQGDEVGQLAAALDTTTASLRRIVTTMAESSHDGGRGRRADLGDLQRDLGLGRGRLLGGPDGQHRRRGGLAQRADGRGRCRRRWGPRSRRSPATPTMPRVSPTRRWTPPSAPARPSPSSVRRARRSVPSSR